MISAERVLNEVRQFSRITKSDFLIRSFKKTFLLQEGQGEGQEEEDEDSSDMSLDESDLSDATTTEVSSEHSDWGSDHAAEVKTPTQTTPSKKKSPKNKKKRRAAQKCRELVSSGYFHTLKKQC